ncbi:MAG: lactate racemase domain-containing protein [Verrucomicrobiota bacterium]|jgi:nickel-dependent lactate racemase
MLYFERGSAPDKIATGDLRAGVAQAMERLGPRRRVLVIPPDFTRFHSHAGVLTRLVYDYCGDRLADVLPALGTHSPVTPAQIAEMFAGVPASLFRVHNWRTGVTTVGEVPAEFVREVSEGAADFAWPAQLANLIWTGKHDLILSIGQVVPHEVIGMASYNKNIFVGTGGAEAINKSHFVGAAYGMERMMGRADTPVRRMLNYAGEKFTRHLPIVYMHTVVSRDEQGKLQVRGLFIGDDASAFTKAADLSLKVNFEMLDEPLKKVVVYLDPGEFKSTWLGNKSVYRTRMAMADGGELVVLAPGLKEFGEDPEIDRLIRKYGYRGTPATLAATRANGELRENLSAAAHLIHGSSEGRFSITYCPGQLTCAEIESVGFKYADLAATMRRYNPAALKDGWNTLPDGERIFYISNPALGLWAWRKRFEN